MARWWNASCLVLLLGSPPTVLAQEDAREVVRKAIAAVGGAEKIDRFRGLKSSARGTAQLFGLSARFTSETTIALPDRMKVVATYHIAGTAYTTEQKAVGDRVSVTLNNESQPLTEEQRAELKAAFVRTEILRLTPLLADKRFTLKSLGIRKEGKKEYVGVAVTGRDVGEVRLYFDRSTSLLSHYETRTRVKGRDLRRVTTLSGYQAFQGLQRPTRMSVTLEGKKVMDVTTTEEKLLEKIDEDEFRD